MNFSDGLQKLSELFPDKFKYIKRGYNLRGYGFLINTPDGWSMVYNVESQDVIDEILAEVGWFFELECLNRTDKNWVFHCWTLGGAVYFGGDLSEDCYSSKLEASKQALIAVTQKFTESLKG